MLISEEILIRFLIAVLGFFGFWVARYIHKHKKKDAIPLVCPMKLNCHAVVHSNYSKFFGIHLEILGMIYYGFVFFIYVLLIFAPEVVPVFLGLILFLSSMGAFLFSLYLISIQLFVLKKGCLWCFVSAFISISIFTLTIFAYDLPKIMQTLIN